MKYLTNNPIISIGLLVKFGFSKRRKAAVLKKNLADWQMHRIKIKEKNLMWYKILEILHLFSQILVFVILWCNLMKPVIVHFDLSTILQVWSHPKSAKWCYGQNVWCPMTVFPSSHHIACFKIILRSLQSILYRLIDCCRLHSTSNSKILVKWCYRSTGLGDYA